MSEIQLSNTGAKIQVRRDARNGSSASRKTQSEKSDSKRTRGNNPECNAAGKVFCSHYVWLAWRIIGKFVIGDTEAVINGPATASDPLGTELLSCIPPSLHTSFLTPGGQHSVSISVAPPRY